MRRIFRPFLARPRLAVWTEFGRQPTWVRSSFFQRARCKKVNSQRRGAATGECMRAESMPGRAGSTILTRQDMLLLLLFLAGDAILCGGSCGALTV